MAEEIKLTQDEAPESRHFIHAFIEEDIGPGGVGGGRAAAVRPGSGRGADGPAPSPGNGGVSGCMQKSPGPF